MSNFTVFKADFSANVLDVGDAAVTVSQALSVTAGGATVTGGVVLDTATGGLSVNYINIPNAGGFKVNNVNGFTMNFQGGQSQFRLGPAALSISSETISMQVAAVTHTVTGGYALQRANVFGVPTFNGAFTLTDAATVTVEGGPAGTATFTRKYQLWLRGTDKMRFDTTTQSTIGANGAASALTANPVGYLPVYIGTAIQIIPYYNP